MGDYGIPTLLKRYYIGAFGKTLADPKPPRSQHPKRVFCWPSCAAASAQLSGRLRLRQLVAGLGSFEGQTYVIPRPQNPKPQTQSKTPKP